VLRFGFVFNEPNFVHFFLKVAFPLYGFSFLPFVPDGLPRVYWLKKKGKWEKSHRAFSFSNFLLGLIMVHQYISREK